MSTPHITQLRAQLLDTLSDLRNRDNPMDPDRARAIAQVASVLVDSAKVEVDYLKATHQDHAPFLETPADASVAHLGHTPATTHHEGPGNGITAITRHSLQG
jgi:hypothetical protein